MLAIEQVQADAAGLATRESAARIASRLFGDSAPAAAGVVVRAGAEVRSTGNLRLSTPWTLAAPAPADPSAAVQAGGMSVVLRAAGDLRVQGDLGAGIDALAGGTGDNAPHGGSGGSVTLVAGAALDAAAPLTRRALAAADATGNVVIGRAAEDGSTSAPATVRTSTGRIDIASARNIVLADPGSAVYSTGQAATERGHAPDAGPLSDQLVPSLAGAGYVDPFLTGGGAVSLRADGDVVGVAAPREHPYVTDWWWRGTADAAVWWSRYDLFSGGVGTFGGGDVSVAAGGDVLQLNAAAAGSGWIATDGSAAGSFGGGSVSVRAAHDVLGGILFAAGPALRLDAGHAIGGSIDADAPQLVHQDSRIQVQAQGDVTLGSVRSAGLTQPGAANNSLSDLALEGLDRHATLAVTSTLGDVGYLGLPQPVAPGYQNDAWTAPTSVIPGIARFAAPAGSLALTGSVMQQPHADGRFDALAGSDVTVGGSLTVNVNRPDDTPQASEPAVATIRLTENATFDGTHLDRSSRSPVRLVAEAGSVTLSGALQTARPLRVLAGQDIVLTNSALVTIQQQPGIEGGAPVSELSLLQAGRDVALQGPGVRGIEIAGPGDLVVMAGRTIDLGVSGGIVALGNQRNSTLLPEGGAHLTLAAGVRDDGHDLRDAVASGYQAIGVSTLLDHPDTVYAWLTTGADATAAQRSAAAAGFAAQPVEAQLRLVTELLGPQADAALQRYLRSVPGWRGLTLEQARSAFAASEAPLRAQAVRAMLLAAFAARPAAQKNAFVADTFAALPATQTAGLVDYLRRVTGTAPAPADAPVAFQALPLERQLPWLRQVFAAELRRAGRAAAQAAPGAEREALYSAGYLALDALFPGLRGEGDILLPTSQVKTLQQADITLLAPGGKVNAGEVVAGNTRKKANELGVVTAAGGDIFAATGRSFEVNQSRVFTLQLGDVLLWSSDGDIDAGRGAKTVTGAPAPVLRLDDDGRLVLDTSGSFSGSGIAVLNAASSLDLYAPRGEINAGEAGIQSKGNAFFGAVRLVGADNLAVAGVAVGAPPAAPTSGATAGLASLGQSAPAAGTQATAGPDDDKRKQRQRRNLLLDFLGFGPAPL